MRSIVPLLMLLFVAGHTASCPHDLEVQCIEDINKAYPVCDEAAKGKAEDPIIDIECFKYFTTVDKDCWPCICTVAEAQHWKVKGCK